MGAISTWINGALAWFRGGGYYLVSNAGSFDGTVSVPAIDSATRMTAYTISRGKVTVTGDAAEYLAILQRSRFIQLLVQDLLLYGNAVYEIDTSEMPTINLRRAASYEIRGKNKVRYKLEISMPDGQTTRNVSADGVLHVRIGELSTSPWHGVSPFAGCELVRILERQLRIQGSWPSQRLFTMPGPEYASARPYKSGQPSAEPVVKGDSEVSNDTFGKPGQRVVRNLNSRGGPIPVPKVDATFEPSQWATVMRGDLVDEVYDCVGIPPVLRGDATPGMAYKTALSEWIDGHLQPLCNGIAEQLSEDLEVDVKIDLAPANIPSVNDQSNALSELVSAGVSLEDAKRVVGLS